MNEFLACSYFKNGFTFWEQNKKENLHVQETMKYLVFTACTYFRNVFIHKKVLICARFKHFLTFEFLTMIFTDHVKMIHI